MSRTDCSLARRKRRDSILDEEHVEVPFFDEEHVEFPFLDVEIVDFHRFGQKSMIFFENL